MGWVTLSQEIFGLHGQNDDPYLILFHLTIIVMACTYNCLKKKLYLTKYYFIIICF